MSWLVNSIAKSLKLDEDEDDEDSAEVATSTASEDDTHRRGVKEDLSELSETFSRQLWGVASFLAPQSSDSQISDPNPESVDRSESSDQDDSNSAGIDGIRSDLSEIGGRFRTGISKLSNNKAVSEFSKLASDFLQFVSEEGETIEDYAQGGVIGISEEVVAFAREVAMHPEIWLDFPLPEEDFDMSEIQQEHTMAVERLAPTLGSLRTELCPTSMSEGCFWKVYFVLVHPRLSKQDAEILSTSQITKARAMLTQDLRTNKSIPDESRSSIDTPSEAASSTNKEHITVESDTNPESVPCNTSVISMDTANTTVDKHALSSDVSKVIDIECDEDPEPGISRDIDIPIEGGDDDDDDNDDDFSFSDLEEDGEEIPVKHKNAVPAKDSNTNVA